MSLHLRNLISVVLVGLCSGAFGAVIYVDDDAAGANNGMSWTDAYVDLKVAIEEAYPGDEIRVGQGVYRPSSPDGDRTESFAIDIPITVVGGYAGCTELEPDVRDVEVYRTILSGDLNGNDVEVSDPDALANEPTRGENAYSVVTSSAPSSEGVLDGFVVTGGRATGEALAHRNGAGIRASRGLTVRNCIIERNSAARFGGGCFSVALMENCIIRHNAADTGGGLCDVSLAEHCVIEANVAEQGGGIVPPDWGIGEYSGLHTECVIRDNRADEGAGAWMLTDRRVRFTDCEFAGNQATGDGGAVYIYVECTCTSRLWLQRCRLYGNEAGGAGGAILQKGNCRVELENCALVGNVAGFDGGGLCNQFYGGMGDGRCSVRGGTLAFNEAGRYGGGIARIKEYSPQLTVVNTILWANQDVSGAGTFQAQAFFAIHASTGDEIVPTSPMSEELTYCCIQGWIPAIGGEANFNQDPEFADLLGEDGTIGSQDDNLRLLSASPCIDVGRNIAIGDDAIDLDRYPRIVNECVDIGAYEYQGPGQGEPGVLYVDDDAAAGGDGSSWAAALRHLQDALTLASAGDEIRVAQGTYRPDAFELSDRPNLGREESFHLRDSVVLRGGFAGPGAADADARDVQAFETVLSGDLNGDDAGGNDHVEDNAYHVVIADGVHEATVLDGLRISGGVGDPDSAKGGGMNNSDASPTVLNCLFTGICGRGGYHGNAISNHGQSSPRIVNCIFEGQGENGAIISGPNCDPVILNCSFVDCHQIGIAQYGGMPTIANCIFVDCDWALFFDYCDAQVRNCLFFENGKDIMTDGGAQPVRINCIEGQNPLWVNLAQGDYRLQCNSPCIDAGDGTGVTEPTDRLGKPRITGDAVDIGPCEFQNPPGGVIWHVDDDAPAGGNGSSWSQALRYLQDALMLATEGDEIRVAQGTYRPDQFTLSDRANLERAESFHLLNGVTIRGGFAGVGALDPDARDLGRYESILSGDRLGNDEPLPDELEDIRIPSRQDNCYHVVTFDNGAEGAVLDGVAIRGGQADNWLQAGYEAGGGICVADGSPLIRDCTIRDNVAGYGGGVHIADGRPQFVGCRIVGNMADNGAGLGNYGESLVRGCSIDGNRARWGGGGVHNSEGLLRLENCRLVNNSASEGGGFFNVFSDEAIVDRCVFYGNRATRGSAIRGNVENDRMILTNSIFWNNPCVQSVPIHLGDDHYSSYAYISYCDIEGGHGGVLAHHGYDLEWGPGILDVDPQFADPAAGGFHLRSQAGRWDVGIGQWVQDEITSPCIDAGDPLTPIMYEPFPNGGVVNMGAYAGTAEASRSWFGAPVCEIIVTGDINGDCSVNLADLALMAIHWLEEHDP